MSSSMPRPEHPRPQFRRERWLCLNGVWDFSFDDGDVGRREGWVDRPSLDGQIVVPFAYQSSLSGIGDRAVHPVMWYRRTFALPGDWSPDRVLLHFGAVDFRGDFWLNGHHLGAHEGGYTPVSFDASEAIRPGENVVVVRCEDQPSHEQPCGKQDRETHEPYCFAATSGIWQTVWLEPVAQSYLDGCRIVPSLATPGFLLTPRVFGTVVGLRLEARAYLDGRLVGSVEMDPTAASAPLAVSEAWPWSPDSPTLYDLELRLLRGGEVVDAVAAYAGLREVAIRGREILLNGQPIYQRQVLDQGYWPDGIYTAPSDAALRADVEWTKRLGFNGARKHQKVEDPRWLYWCDRLGLLVWDEMASFKADTPRSREWLRREWRDVVRRDLNSPSVVAWVPFNESFGIRDISERPDVQDFVAAVVADTRQIDSTRPVVDNSGWEHVDTDVADTHNYEPAGELFLAAWRGFHEGGDPALRDSLRTWNGHYRGREWYGSRYRHPFFVPGRAYSGQPILVSEWGGFFLAGRGEVAPILAQRRGVEPDSAAFVARYRDMIAAFDSLPDLVGDCWTQLTDVEDEPNGLLAEDRQPKLDPEQIWAINTARFRS